MKANRTAAMSSSLALVTTFVTVAALILACGSSYPSESAGRRILENEGRDPIRPFNVKKYMKTNGLEKGGQYTLEYEAEIECTKIKNEPSWAVVIRGQVCREIGEIHKISDKIQFEKTENGWRAPDGKIY
jgi:hypothetical protein